MELTLHIKWIIVLTAEEIIINKVSDYMLEKGCFQGNKKGIEG